MSIGPIGLATTQGVIAAFNPCGFAMLPAYVSYFVGASSTDAVPGLRRRLLRAALASLCTTVGFVTIFAAFGFVIGEVFQGVGDKLPYVSMVIGVAMVALGIAMLRGFEPKLPVPKIKKARSGRGMREMFIYGVSYALVSLGCTIGPFTATVVGTLHDGNVLGSILAFVAYGIGMGLVLTVLSFAIAGAQQAFVRGLRRVLPYVNRVSGALMVLIGMYVAWYGYYDYRLIIRGDLNAPAGPVGWVTNWSNSLQNLVLHRVGLRGIVIVLLLVLAAIVALLIARPRHHSRSDTSPSTTSPLK
jgi:cytochrome c-type biogenesis protein